jgi:hypothetical protein
MVTENALFYRDPAFLKGEKIYPAMCGSMERESDM